MEVESDDPIGRSLRARSSVDSSVGLGGEEEDEEIEESGLPDLPRSGKSVRFERYTCSSFSETSVRHLMAREGGVVYETARGGVR